MDRKLIAYHLDLKHGLWTRPYLESLVQRLGVWGYNTLVLELEDKMQFATAPGVASPDAMTPAEVTSFVSYCREQGLEVIPLVQSLGHAEYVVGKPAYAHLRESADIDTQYDPLSSEARQLIMGLFDEAIAAIGPQSYFHIGGDETWCLGSSEKAKAFVAEHGLGGLYLQHILPLCEHVRQHGLRPMIWADMFLSYPELLDRVPDYAMLVDWDYWTTSPTPDRIMVWGGFRQEHGNASANAEQYPQVLRKPGFKEHLHPYTHNEQGRFTGFYCTDALRGHGVTDVLVAPANSCGGDLNGIPRNHIHIPNCWYGARKGLEDGSGFLVTSWSVRHVHPEVRQLGTFAAAQAIDGGSYDFDEICLAYSTWMHGTPLKDFPEAVRLSAQSSEMCQAYRFVRARKALAGGEDIYQPLLEEQIAAAGGKEPFVEQFTQLRDDYLQARELFDRMSSEVTRNAEHFAYWLEGVELSVLHTEFVLAMCQGTLPQQSAEFVRRIAELRRNSEQLFAPSFTPEGLDEEIQVRYGFHELYLQHIGSGAASDQVATSASR